MKAVTISCGFRTLEGSIRLPGSKSISNRLLIIRALSGKDFPISNLSEADDTVLLVQLLEKIRDYHSERNYLELDTRNAGTVMRFLTAYLSMMPGKWVLTGSDRMKERPVGILVDSLKTLGADIEYLSRPGFPPLLIHGKPLRSHALQVRSDVSSQFASAILMIAPMIPRGLTVDLTGEILSLPYIDMTVRLMKQAGIPVAWEKNKIRIKYHSYIPVEMHVESDWTSASYWYEMAALAEDVDLELEGLHPESLQGDSVLPGIYQNFGVKTEFTKTGVRLSKYKKKVEGYFYDFSNHPDISMSVVATCAFMGLRGRFEGLKSLEIKETDRLAAIRQELKRLGIPTDIDPSPDGAPSLELQALKKTLPPGMTIETYNDHRLAMSFAPLAIRTGSVRIMNPDVVNKSYPHFWEDLASVGFIVK